MIKNILTTVAAAGLLVAPIAAQAGTRAAEAGVSMDSLTSVERSSSTIGQAESADGGIPTWLLILLFAAVGAGVIAATESGEDNRSPGT